MTTAQQLGAIIKSARQIMRKDKGLSPKSDMAFKTPEISACFGVLKAIFLQFLLTTINSRVFWLGIKGNSV